MPKTNLLRYTSLVFATGLLLAGCTDDSDDELEPETPDEEVVAPDPEDDDSNDADTDDETDVEVSQDLEVWFPKLEDTLLEFEGEGSEYASFTRYPQFVHDDTFQLVESTAGTDVVTVYEYTDEEIREVFVRPETYFRDDVMDTGLNSAQDDHEILLQLPIEVGHSWESPNGSMSEITDVDFEFETEFGTFEAIEVTRTIEDSDIVYYYADGIGLVERISNPGDDEMEITSTLVSLSEDQPEEMSVTVYSLDDQGMGLVTTTVPVELYTNDPIRNKLADVLRGEAPDSEAAALVTEGVDINYMYLGNDDIAYADFSIELTSEMQAGSGIEGLIVQGIINTIGDYYTVEEVYLTVDGDPYSSGHFELPEGETWPVDYSSVISD